MFGAGDFDRPPADIVVAPADGLNDRAQGNAVRQAVGWDRC